MLITDSQVHIWEVDWPERPWPPGRNEAQLPNGYSAETHIAEMDAIGVDRAVIVPPTYVGEMNDTAIEACDAYPGRFAIMGRFDPKSPGARERLQTWLDIPHMKGIRMTFRIQPYITWLDDDGLDWFFADCERLGIPLMILVPEIIEKVAPIAGRYPGLQLIMDHMGVIPQGRMPDVFNRIDELLDLSKFANVTVKTSSAPCFSNEDYPFADIYEPIKRIYDAFGPERLMWGADITRLRGSYGDCLRHFEEGLDFLSEGDKRLILGENIARVINWPEPV